MAIQRNFRMICLLTAAMLINIAQAGTYTSDFGQYFATNQSKDQISAVITLTDRVDLEALKAELSARKANRQEWHEAVVKALQEKATESQADVLARLSELEKQGLVSNYDNLWLGNIIIVNAIKDALDEIVLRADVDQIAPNYEIESIKDEISDNAPTITSGIEPGLTAIRANEVWAMGYTGEGRLVSHLDTGVNGDHEALAGSWRGLDSRYAENPGWAWYDPVTETTFPFDEERHGTHTMGTICGLGEEYGDTIGVAYGSEWISAGVIDRVNSSQTVADALTAFQWIADPDGDPATVWDVPDVCSNSWGVYDAHGYDPCDATFWSAIDGVEAAGVVVVFAAGNEGESGSSTIRRPSDRATTNVNVFSVGAVYGYVDGFPIAEFSSRGPSSCTDDGSVAIKPEICAPGVNVRSSYKNDYRSMSGTSMATPHVAGVVALMREANPDLSCDEIKQILLETASDLGDEGEDNTYGMGMLDAYEAVQHALALRGDLGALAGTITDESTGEPIEGVTISIVDGTSQATTDSDGRYSLFLTPNNLYDIKVSSPEYLTIYDQQSVAVNETTTVNYILEPRVKATFKVSFSNDEDASYRNFYIKGSWDNDGYFDASWSGDLVAMTDDGESADETADDGIFTADVYLGSDQANTYQWAVYTENYGVNNTDDAFLANGSDFDIDSFDPVIVPTLEPSPSGSDNNFIFSVEGDNGLSLDLEPYTNGVRSKWGGSVYLTADVTYTFAFHVMHGDEAVYGEDGVGGDEITYTPTADGAYDFIFNDADDSYIIQLSETNGPPSFLGATSGQEHYIPVGWAPPGVSSSLEIAYDDGVAYGGWYSTNLLFKIGVMFVPESYPVLIDSVMVHMITEGDRIWPWPNGSNDTVGISIYLDDGSGYPDDEPVYYEKAVAEPGNWIRLDIDEIVITSGNFWVFQNAADHGRYDGMARDEHTDYPANQWYSTGYDSWAIGAPYGGDNLIRAKIFSNDASAWLAYDDGIAAGEASAPVFSGNIPDEYISSNEISISESNVSNLAYHPHILSDPPVITETETIYGYNLYRSTTSGPFEQGQKINSSPIYTIYYDDWGDDSYGPIENGVTYYYEASTVYNIGGENIEVGPSNEASAAAVNKPPQTPVNLTGDVSDLNTVSLSWDANTDYDIAAYNIYRRGDPGDDFALVGTVSHPATTFSEVISVDGTYRYCLKAVDAHGLESESFSYHLDLCIGLIPPGQLFTSTDLEFQIKSEWRAPGNSLSVPLSAAIIVTSSYNTENGVLEYLSESGLVSDYSVYIIEDSTLTISQLEPHDIAMVWSSSTFFDADSLGNVLADFVDLGKPVILFESCFREGREIGGRFMDEYCPFGASNVGINETSLSLGEYDESSPLMKDVNELTSILVFDVPVKDNAQVVAYWENDYPAIGISTINSIISVNAFIGDIYYKAGGDIWQFIYNAVEYAANNYGTDPDGYRLYKSDSEDGVYELLATLDGDIREYVDSSATVNDVPYYYRVSAIWDGVESEPSNIYEGMGKNQAPEAPTDLAVTIDEHDVSLYWSFSNLKGDFDHYNVYRRTTDDSSWEFVGDSTDTTYTDNPTEDGIYEYCVTAVDNGDPQLESDLSNIVKAPVGNLPPQQLTAKSNQDSVVPLSWYAFDYLACSELLYDDGVAANGYYLSNSEFLMAKQFTATAPVEICSLFVHVITNGDDIWPWPDDLHDNVTIEVWDDDGTGQPGNAIYDTSESCEDEEWIKIGLSSPIVCTTDNFWISCNCNTMTREAIGIDAASDFPTHDWTYQGLWMQGPIYDGDHMIRASIVINDGVELLTEDNPESQTVTLQKSLDGNNTPQLYDTEEILGYYIYRSTSEDVPVDDDHRITSSYITETLYDDEEVENGTTYYYTAVAAYNNNGTVEYSIASNEISAIPMAAGQLTADSVSITVAADTSDEAVTVPLTLTNDGGLPVTFAVNITTDNSVINVNPDINYAVDGKFSTIVPTLNNSDNSSEDNETPVVTDNGGPDGFGYYWVDSEETNGPEYNWVDITGIGQQITDIHDQNTSTGPFYMEFNFPYYGNTYSTFGVSGYGWMAFVNSSEGEQNVSLPSTEAPYTMIAPCWDYYEIESGEEYYYYSTEDSTIVSWINVNSSLSAATYNFQVILTPDGAITFQYKEIESEYYSYYCVGIQNTDGSDGLGICYNLSCFDNQSAIAIKLGWLRADPFSGVVDAGSSLTLDVILDPGNIDDDGNYYGILELSSYDMNHDLDPIEIPVTFAVGDTVDIDDGYTALPTVYSLDQNYPNPFNAKTEIKYGLPSDSDVKLDVYNVLGQKVVTLVDEKQQAGYYSIIWNGTNESGRVVSSGIYFYNLTTSGGTINKSMVLLK